MLGVSGIVLRACQLRPSPDTYDEFVADFGPRVVSYWRFENSGADAKGTQHATITGSPELNVETIVDLDTVAEGAPADGECIAWPGTRGVYAEAAHNPAHKTAEGSIVVTFQRDAQSLKSTLVAADRSVGETSTGPGGLSIEVETNGAPRCFLRRQSDGAPVILLGQAGDVALNEAYTLIFKWGAPGLSLALWNEDGTLVRRLTDPLTDGVTGSSPIRFGLWHNDSSSPHDGPFGRVVWLDRRIGDEEEADLARPRTISREMAPGDYTPFPFVTISNPPVDHSGVAHRPGYSPTDPRSASIIDPMSGLEVFRVGGNTGSTVFINGTTNSGFVFPRRLRNENNSKGFKTWNADSTLLMIERRFAQTNDPANSASSYLIDVDGSHGASAPWRIIRVNPTQGLSGAGGSNGGSPPWWFWDPLNPLRAYAIYHDGRLAEWWPIGGAGHSVGEINTLYGPLPSGFGSVHGADDRPGACTPTPDGRFRVVPCRWNAQGRWGGFRQNLQTGAFSAFMLGPTFGFTGSSLDHGNRAAAGVSYNGQYTGFSPNGNRYQIFDFAHPNTNLNDPPNNLVLDTDPTSEATHTCWLELDGVQYHCGVRSDTVALYNVASGSNRPRRLITTAQFQGANPNHLGSLNWNDTYETYGATGAGTSSGIRYVLYTRSNPRNGHPRGIMGIRTGANDVNRFRYICNHRSVRSSNSSECHAHMDRNARYVVFNSNWHEPGVVSDGDVHPYVAAIPDGWKSPNNDGS